MARNRRSGAGSCLAHPIATARFEQRTVASGRCIVLNRVLFTVLLLLGVAVIAATPWLYRSLRQTRVERIGRTVYCAGMLATLPLIWWHDEMLFRLGDVAVFVWTAGILVLSETTRAASRARSIN
jgi:hypothetical protein